MVRKIATPPDKNLDTSGFLTLSGRLPTHTGPVLRSLPSLVLVTLAACGGPAPGPALPVVEVHPGGARTVHLPGGGTLELERAPSTVLPGSASATDIVVDLLPAERVAALTELALDYSKLAGDLPAELAARPRFGAFQAEVVLDLGPDLVLTHTWQDPAMLEALTRRGIPCLALPVGGDWPELLESIRVVARLLDVEARGAELVASLEARREALAARAPEPLRLLSFSTYGDALWTNGSGTTYDLMIRLAGHRNAAAEAGLEGNTPVRMEELLELDPDAFVMGEGAGSTGIEFLRGHELLSELRAVREGRFLVLPSHLFSTSSHEVLRAAEVLADLATR